MRSADLEKWIVAFLTDFNQVVTGIAGAIAGVAQTTRESGNGVAVHRYIDNKAAGEKDRDGVASPSEICSDL